MSGKAGPAQTQPGTQKYTGPATTHIGGGVFIPKDPIIRLAQYVKKQLHITMQGGRQVEGTLVGFDHLNSLILDETKEFLRTSVQDLYQVSKTKTRSLGMCVIKSSVIETITDANNRVEIANPFADGEE